MSCTYDFFEILAFCFRIRVLQFGNLPSNGGSRRQLAKLALLSCMCKAAHRNECLQRDPKSRPSMHRVREALQTKARKTRASNAIPEALDGTISPRSLHKKMLQIFDSVFSSAAVNKKK